jgi:hypothetical protein
MGTFLVFGLFLHDVEFNHKDHKGGKRKGRKDFVGILNFSAISVPSLYLCVKI